MANTLLCCNVQSCRRKLNKQACVTTCSHIFCEEHMQNMTSNRNDIKCLACGTQFSDDLCFALTNLNPTEQYKAMILSGLNPDQIMEIATRAISFFIYQASYENKNKENILRHRKDQIEELKHYCQTLTTKYKADLHKFQRTIQSVKGELEEKVKEAEKQQQYIEQCQRENKKLQSQLECFKRELVNMRTFPKKENFPYTPNSHTSNNKNGQSRYSDSVNTKHFCFGNTARFMSPFDLHVKKSH